MTAASTTPRPAHNAPKTVSGLVRKRAEIAGQIDLTQLGLGLMIADLGHIDAAIRIFARRSPPRSRNVRLRSKAAVGPAD